MGKYVVLGGPHVSGSPEECEKYADTLILGEGEYSLKQFLKDYENKEAKKNYTTEKVNMSDSPIPAYHLLDMKSYRMAGINYTRGCPFDCEFCDIKEEWFNGRVPRLKEVNQILKELDILKKYGKKNIFMHDDNFIAIPERTKELLRAIIKWQEENNYKFDFSGEASINIAKDDELLDLFRKANFKLLFIGIETPNVESLKASNKLHNIQRNLLGDIVKIQKNGITLTAGLITGFDNDKKDIFEKMYNFIQKTGILFTSLGPLIVLPKTKLSRRMKEEGRLLDKQICHPALRSKINQGLGVNFIPKNMDGKELVEGTNWVLKKIYSHKGFTERYWQYIKNLGSDYNTTSHSNSDITNTTLKKKIKFTLTMFFASPRQSYYNLKLLVRILLFKPKLVFPFIVDLAMHKHIYDYYKELIGDPDKVGKCPIKLNDDEKCSIAVSKLSKIVEEMPNPAEPIDKNINMLCDMLEDIGKCITKENIIKLKDGCVSRLKKIKSLNLGESIKEKQLLKDDLNKFLTVVKYCN